MPKILKQPYFYTSLLAFVALCLLIGPYVLGWTTPTSTPPGGNLPAPINTSSANQGKIGYLAVGTSTTPTYPLEVYGQVKITGGSPGTGKVLTSDSAGLASWATGGGGGSPGGSDTQVQFNNSGSFGGDSNFVWNSSTDKLGIGIASPTAKLSVGPNAVGANIPTYFSVISAGRLGVVEDNRAFYFDIQGTPRYAEFSTYKYDDSTTFPMVFQANGGNVGIGTTPTTSAKLEVAGQIKITGGSPGTGKVLTSDANGLASWGTAGSGITSLNSQTGATQTFANDTNVTMSSATNTHTLGWTGLLSIARGGTNASSLTANKFLAYNGTSIAATTYDQNSFLACTIVVSACGTAPTAVCSSNYGSGGGCVAYTNSTCGTLGLTTGTVAAVEGANNTNPRGFVTCTVTGTGYTKARIMCCP